jgi:hypothetical protein
VRGILFGGNVHYADIRDRVWAAADYAPAASPEGAARTREHINRALMRIAQDAPFLFERDVPLYLDPDVRPDNSEVEDSWRSLTAFDPWVLRTTWSTAVYPDLARRFTEAARPHNGWYFECRDPADPTGQRILSFRIREIWTDDADGGSYVFMSLFEPTPYDTPGFAPTAGGGVGVITDWRITMKQYALPPEVIEIQSVKPYDTTDDLLNLRYITASEAAEYSYEAAYWNDVATTMPWVVWPGTVETLTNMNAAPRVGGGAPWSAAAYAEPQGEFAYVYTLSLGYRHDEVQDFLPVGSDVNVANASGRRMPYIESPPSPIAGPINATVSIIPFTPSYPALIGYEDATTLRYRRVGLVANFYRRRITVDPGYALAWPTSNHFQHIATSTFLANGIATFTDDGESVPGRRLRRVGGYKTLRFSHSPDKIYRLVVRAVVRPHEMLDDSDACEIPPSAIDALIFLSLRNLYEASGNPSMAINSFADYERALHALKKRHASLKPAGQTWKMRLRTSRRRSSYRHHDVIDTP